MVKKNNLIPAFVLYLIFLFFGVSFCVAETGLNDKSETKQQVLSDDQVTISGKIIFEEYKEGLIVIVAYSKEPPFDIPSPSTPLSIEVARQTIASPGEFIIKVPKQSNKVYLEATCLCPDGIVRKAYENNPIELISSNIENIDIELFGRLPLKD